MNHWKILLVDDEVNVLNALRRTLRREPYDLHCCEGPEQALESLKKIDVDLVISDHLMPGMDGLTFLRVVKNLYPRVLRVILTGHADVQMAISAINEGEVFRFLTKPWNDDELKVTLKHLFDFIDLRRENQALLDTVRKQDELIESLESKHPGIFQVKRDVRGYILLDDQLDFSIDMSKV